MNECLRVLKEGALYPVHVFRRHHALRECARLAAHSEPKVRAIAAAIKEAIEHQAINLPGPRPLPQLLQLRLFT